MRGKIVKDRTLLINAKIKLYHELLAIEEEKLSETDIELGFQLAKDADIQNLLSNTIKKQSEMISMKESKVKVVETDDDALKHKNAIVVCLSVDSESKYKCFECGHFVKCSSPAFKKMRKICVPCVNKRNDKDTFVVSRQSVRQAVEKVIGKKRAKAG